MKIDIEIVKVFDAYSFFYFLSFRYAHNILIARDNTKILIQLYKLLKNSNLILRVFLKIQHNL